MKRIRPPFAFATATLSRLVLAGLIALPAAAVMAQASAPATAPAAPTAAPAQAAPADKDAHAQGHHMGKHDPAKMQARVAKRQAALKEKLKITSAQEPAWTAFTAAMKPPANAMRDRHAQHAELQKLPTPERIDKMRALRTQHMAEMSKVMEQRGDATKTFYAALTPEQKKTFDAEAAQRGGRHGGDHHGGKHRNS
jgi:periplasmic protein CpxP/Spy